jgi:hypothetical protein
VPPGARGQGEVLGARPSGLARVQGSDLGCKVQVGCPWWPDRRNLSEADALVIEALDKGGERGEGHGR